MTNPSPGLPQPVRRVPLTELRERAYPAFPSDRHYTNAERRLPPRLHQSVRRVVPRPPSNAASFSGFPELSNQCGELFPESHAVRRTVLRTKTAQHSPSVMRVSKYNGLRAHTHASTRRLCRPCLCFFYNFFINIILFYYWVTNRDFIDLFCHTPQT